MPSFSKSMVLILAQTYDWTCIADNHATGVLGFSRYGVQRMNIYYTTGTVGTSLHHPRQGKTQLFRRNVSLQQLEDLFADPGCHTGKGYYRRCLFQSSTLNPEPWLRRRSCRGSRWLMRDLVRNDYDPDESPILALGGTWLTVHGATGLCSWGNCLPKPLDAKLRARQQQQQQQQRTLLLPHVDVVCLGADDDTYFVQFADGQAQWHGLPHALGQELADGGGGGVSVQTLALGRQGSYYCRWSDGSASWEGLPPAMDTQLHGRQKKFPPPELVTMGPRGEWFVRFADGDWRCNGHTQACNEAIWDIQNQGLEVVHIAFGHYDSWLIVYE